MRLAHFSDPHFLSLEGARVWDFLNKRWTGGVNNLLHRGRHYRGAVVEALVADLNAQAIDHVACTGDITSVGLDAEFRAGRACFDRLAAGPEHLTCIPGNHDVYVRAAVGKFERILAPYCAADPAWRWPDGVPWPIVRVRGDLAIVGVSTSRPTPWFLAYGEVGASQLARLERVLGDPRLEGKFRVVLLHHPPAGLRGWSPIRGLHDRGALAAVLRRAGAELLLHGHEHAGLEAFLEGPGGRAIPVRGVESASYDRPGSDRGARYCIHRIGERDGAGRPRLLETSVRAWRRATGDFG